MALSWKQIENNQVEDDNWNQLICSDTQPAWLTEVKTGTQKRWEHFMQYHVKRPSWLGPFPTGICNEQMLISQTHLPPAHSTFNNSFVGRVSQVCGKISPQRPKEVHAQWEVRTPADDWEDRCLDPLPRHYSFGALKLECHQEKQLSLPLGSYGVCFWESISLCYFENNLALNQW